MGSGRGKAGFWAIGGYRISFRRDGRWYADDEPIENKKIARLFSRHVRADGAGGWLVDLGIDRQTVEVEDTPLVVVSVDGDRDRGFIVHTNDGESSPLDCSSLKSNRQHVLYCTVDRGERGSMPARFLRPAYYQLTTALEEDAGEPVLVCAGRRYRIACCEDSA